MGLFKGTISGGVFTPTGTILAPTDDPLAQNLRTGINPVTTTATYALPKFSLAAGETLFVDYWRHQTAGITTGTVIRRQLDFQVNDGVAQVAHPAADDTGPTHTSFTVAEGTSPTRQYFDGTSTVFYNPAAAGDFVVTDAITDAGSGPYSVDFPGVNLNAGAFIHTAKTDIATPFTSNTYAWTTSSTTEPGAQTITEEDLAKQQTLTTLTIKKDTAAPTAHSVTLAGAGAPYYTTLSVPLTLVDGNDGTGSGLDASTRLVERESGDLAADACTNWSGTWSTAPLSGGADTNVISGKCYRYRYKISDNVANQSAASAVSAAAKVDTSAPTPAPTLTLAENPASANQHVSGTTLFYKGGAAGGSFKVTSTGPADPETGIKHIGFPSVVGLTGGGTNDTGSPFEDTYSWSNTTSGSPTGSVTATNNASVAGSGTNFTLTSDTTAPTGHSVSLAGAGAPYYGSLSVPLTLVDGGDGAGAGLDTGSRVVERESGDLASDACTNWSGSWSTVTLSGGADTTVVSGKCYRYRFTISDNVGNQSAVSATSADAKVDAGDPSVSVASPTEVTGPAAQYYDSATKTHYVRPGGAGSFTLNATASDTETAVTGVAFPDVSAVSGWAGSTGGNDASSPYASPADYAWTAGATEPGPRTITATDQAGRTANDTVTIAADSSAPTGHSVSLAGAGAPYYRSLSVPLTLADGSDTGSGIDTATRIVERESGDLAADACTNWSGSWSTVTLSGGADTTVVSGKCYRYRYSLSDRVGNQSAASAVSAAAKVDTSNPAAPSLSLAESPADPDQHVSGTDVYYLPGANGGSFTVTATASDTETGVKHVSFPGVTGVTGGGGNDASSPYSDTYTWSNTTSGSPTGAVTATNNASATGGGTSFGLVPDSGAPSTGDDTGSIGSGWKTSAQTVTLTPSDSGASVATTYYTTDGSTPDTSSAQGTSISLSADGVYTIKYFSVDRVGNAEVVQTGAAQIRIDAANPSSATLDALPAAIRNGQVLSGSAADATSGVSNVAYYRCAGTSCTPATLVGSSSTGPSYSVTWNSQPADGDYQILARATDAAGNALDSTKQTVKVDNSDPTGSLTSPAAGASLAGTVAVASNSADAVSGVAQVVFQRSPAGAGTWTPIDTDSSAPYSVDWLTGGVSDGDYDLRAVTTDGAGNSFTSGSVTVEVDNTAPSASLDDPGANLRGTVSLTGTAGDPGGSGVASLAFQRSPAGGGTWTTIHTDTSSPYSASFDTTGVSDGLYDLRAVATDVAGNATVSTLVANRRVDNTNPAGSITAPADASVVNGLTAVSSDSADAGSGVQQVVFQRSPAGAGTWTAIDTDTSAPYSVDWATGSLPDGSYDLRAVTTDVAGNGQTSATVGVVVDNNAPSVSLTAPSAFVNAAAPDPFTVTATSPDTDIDVEFFRCSNATTGCASGSWVSLGTDATAPYAASWNLDGDGNRALRAIATDLASNTATDTDDVTIDRVAPAGGADDPGSSLRGTVTLTGSGSDLGGSGVTSLTFQRSPAGGGTWTTIDTDTSSPYSASFDTTGVSDGLYDLRVIVIDNAGNQTISAAVANRRVDNTAPNASMDDPGANLSGTVNLTSSASDPGGSGVATRTYQHSPAGAGTWTPMPTAWDTTGVSDGSYDLRVIVTDVAGNSTTSAAVTGRLVDNDAPSVSITAPSGYVNAAAPDPFTVTATSPDSDVDEVEFFRCSNSSANCGSGSWVSLGTDSAAPYSASWNVDADGNRSLGAEVRDAASNSGSDVVAVTIDRTAPADGFVTYADGYDVDGSVAVSTDAGTDSGSGINLASGTLERDEIGLAAGSCGGFAGTWTIVSAPDTSVASGTCYRYRYRVADNAGNVTTYTSLNVVKVDAATPVTTDDAPAGWSSAPILVTLAPTDTGGSGIASTEYKVDGGATQTGTSVSVAAPADGSNDGVHTISYRSTDGAGNVESWRVAIVRIDASAPGLLPADPGDDLRGTVALSATATDPSSGVAFVRFQSAPAGSGLWTTISTDPTAPFSASWDTTGLTDGNYDLRFVATDGAANTTSAVLAGKTVDNTAPTVALTTPVGGTVSGSVPVAAAAVDLGSGLASVTFRVRPAGGTYSTISTDTTSPFTATWDSRAGADGSYELVAVATDLAGGTATSIVVTVTVDNDAPVVTLGDPGTNVNGTVPLAATSSGDTAQVTFERRPAAGGAWAPIGTDASAPFTTDFDTTAVPDGSYELRAGALDGSGNTGTSATRNVRVDNTDPSGSLTAPAGGATVGGVVSVQATASDAGGSGVADVTMEFRAVGAPGWTALAEDTSAPYAASWNTAGLDGGYELRAGIDDLAGNTSFSATVTVTVDGSAPTVTLTNPGATLSGSVNLTATAPDASVVVFAYRATGAASWTAIATDTAAPWSASFATGSLANGTYDLRATASDSFGNSAADVRAGVRIENTQAFGAPTDGQAPTTPPGFSGSLDIKGRKLTLRWGSATDTSGVAPIYVLLVAGARSAVYPATQRQTVVDGVKAGDLRAFQIQAEDEAGNRSAPSYALKVLPVLKKLTVRAATAALAKRGFRQGKMTKNRSTSVPVGRVIGAAGPAVARVGTAVPLLVSSGSHAFKSVLVLRVSSLRVLARSSHKVIRVNVDLSLAARVRTSLLNNTEELFAWRSGLGAGTTLLKLDIPSAALRQSRYTLLVTAVGPDGKTVTARVPIRIEPQSTPGETEQGGTTPAGSLNGDGDPPAAEPIIDSPLETEAFPGRGGLPPHEPAPGESLALSSPEATARPSAAPAISSVAASSSSSRKEAVGTVLLLGMLGLGSALAGYKARSLLSFVLRSIHAR
ncbi:MAG TPA: Ig-like domain-containing protein [Gaiellaceae bacterium]|nr:Ig-like domain-containing protein [Gaiellaceae bacterium]